MTSSPATTLSQALECAAAGSSELVFHLADGAVTLSAETLLDQAHAGARALAERGIEPGDAVGVLGPNGPEWARWAFAAWLAGGSLVPIPYHLRIRDAEAFRLQVSILTRAAGCRAVVVDPNFLPFVGADIAMRWDEDPPRVPHAPAVEPRPEDVAVIQFTSGSTATPRGAVLTHRAVLAGVRGSEAGSGQNSAGWVQLSWLPFFHDWGLFGYLVWSVVIGTQTHILPTERFARDPSEWLRLAGRVGAMITPGPTSAWDSALRVAGRRPQGIDLSTIRVATLAAEAIEPRVLDRLLELGVELGLSPEAPSGAYGMAETTLAVTEGPVAEPIRVDAVDRGALVSIGEARPATGSDDVRRVVSSGAPVPGVELLVAGSEGPVPERHVGEILLRTPSMMRGYIGGTEDPVVDGWLHTGDLGYLADGELYVTGRIKDVVIVMGRNYPAQDLEWAAERVEGVRSGRTVAFATERTEGEAVVVVECGKGREPDDLPRRVWLEVSDALGIAPREVLVLPGGTIPVTTSGKLRRSWVRDAYASGDLQGVALARGPSTSGSDGPAAEAPE
jgi:acyl-CoA synthetase (AMP-forming)/AMP-acid ligase II